MEHLEFLALPCLVAFLLRRRSMPEWRALDGRYTPVVVGLIWAGFPLAAWGTLNPLPTDHDEIAYLLQAEIFAAGRWAVESPPVPELFAQPHVLVTPVLASKYPPGHSLLLALGALAGIPAIVVYLLNALRAGLVFALARRLSDAPTALLTVVALYMSDDQVRFSSSYFSQLTSGALLVTAWYCLQRWQDNRRRGWLIGVAAALGWIAITRPWSAVAFALPIGFVVLRTVWRDRRWRDLGIAMAVGTCILGLIPLWSWATLGDWRMAPLARYTRDYMPFDYPHFGSVNVEPRLTPPPEVERINESLREVERTHTVANLGPEAAKRARDYWERVWPAQRLVLVGLTIIGLVMLPTAAWLGVSTLVTTFVLYLAHPTWSKWTVYYFEVVPVLTFLGVLGFTTLLRALAGEPSKRGVRLPSSRTTAAVLFACVLLLPAMVIRVLAIRLWLTSETDARWKFEQGLTHLPITPAIVFVRYAPEHSAHRILVVNRADWRTRPVWVVRAVRPAADSLLARAPDRQPYMYAEEDDRFIMLRSDARQDSAPAANARNPVRRAQP